MTARYGLPTRRRKRTRWGLSPRLQLRIKSHSLSRCSERPTRFPRRSRSGRSRKPPPRPVWWQAINGVPGLDIMESSHRLSQQQTPMDPHATGSLPGWTNFFLTLRLAFVVVGAAYGIVFVLDYFFKTDFRLWLIAVKAFTPD